jgi:HK97 family phage major capsid protein
VNPQLKRLTEKCDSLKASMKEILATAEAEGRDVLTEEEQAKFDAMKPELAKAEQARENLIFVLDDARANAKPAESCLDLTPPAATHIVVKPQVQDPKRGFKCLGDFAMSVVNSSRPGGMVDNRLTVQAAITGMGQTVGAEGGFLVPPEFSAAIWDGLNNGVESLLPLTDNYTVTGESLTFNANAETSRATGSRYGGVRGYWLAEGDQITSSVPKFRQVKIEPQQLAVLVYVTDKLLKNASAVDSYVSKAATEEIMFLVNDAIINGTGAGQPLGVTTAPCTVSVAKETGQAAKTIVYENVSKMYMRMLARSRAGARWFINQDCEDQLRHMTIEVGTAGLPVYLPAGGASGQPYGTLFGLPVQPIEYCQTLGTAGDIILANLGAYVTGTRGGVDSAMSMHLRFDYNESCFRFLFEVDGQPWLASALTPFKGSNTLSTFITLATRA